MLMNILHAFAEYKKLSVAFAVAVVLMIFGWIMAGRSIARRNRERDIVLEKLRRDKALRRKFADLTAERALEADGKELLHALSVQTQVELEKADNMEKAFAALSTERQYIYALNYLLCEDADTISQFFRLNGAPLTDVALAAGREMFPEYHLPLMEKAYKMFDSNDETTSALPDDIAALDAAFAQNADELFCAIRQYIANHAQAFEYHMEG